MKYPSPTHPGTSPNTSSSKPPPAPRQSYPSSAYKKTLPDLLLQITYIGLHNYPHHQIVPPPSLPHLGGMGGGSSIIWDIGVHG